MRKYHVIRKSAGYSVKSFKDEESARNYADKCCKANRNSNYAVYVYRGGVMEEI